MKRTAQDFECLTANNYIGDYHPHISRAFGLPDGHKKCQKFQASSGADAMRKVMAAARLKTRHAAFTKDDPKQACYYCEARPQVATCHECQSALCDVCSLGGTQLCLNCHVQLQRGT